MNEAMWSIMLFGLWMNFVLVFVQTRGLSRRLDKNHLDKMYIFEQLITLYGHVKELTESDVRRLERELACLKKEKEC